MPAWFFFVPMFAPLFMALSAIPVTIGCIKWLGAPRAIRLLIALSAFAYIIETIALRTGFPYGTFTYTEHLGYKLFGTTPWTVPFGWVPLIIASWTLAWRYTSSITHRFILTIGTLVTIDLILDPAAVSLGFWKYAHPGLWGGVPYTNFLGWMLSGFVGCLILHAFTKQQQPSHANARLWLLTGFLPAIGTVVLWLVAQ
jgi:putative membrane protein